MTELELFLNKLGSNVNGQWGFGQVSNPLGCKYHGIHHLFHPGLDLAPCVDNLPPLLPLRIRSLAALLWSEK